MRHFLAACLIVAICSPAAAETIVTCGSSEGHAYYLAQGLVPAKDSGWQKDKISSGSFALSRNGDTLDILYKDASGQMNSSLAEKAVVSLIGTSEANITVAVIHPKSAIEIYTFDLANKIAVWTQNKYGAPINKAAVFQAKCQ